MLIQKLFSQSKQSQTRKYAVDKVRLWIDHSRLITDNNYTPVIQSCNSHPNCSRTSKISQSQITAAKVLG